jgi:hypothetical protein
LVNNFDFAISPNPATTKIRERILHVVIGSASQIFDIVGSSIYESTKRRV